MLDKQIVYSTAGITVQVDVKGIIGIEMLKPVAHLYFEDFAAFGKLGQVAVDRAEAYIGYHLTHRLIYGISAGVGFGIS